MPTKAQATLLSILLLSWACASRGQPGPDDALWIYAGDTYLDLTRDGKLTFVAGRHSSKKSVRRGDASPELTQRAFQVVQTRDVLGARDSDPGEQILSSDKGPWVTLGFEIGAERRSAPPWGYTEELLDYPQQFQDLVKGLSDAGRQSPRASNVVALLLATPLDPDRAEKIRTDPRGFYAFVEVTEDELAAAPSLQKAIASLTRIVPVEDGAGLNTIERYKRQSDLQSVGQSFFLTVSGSPLQCEVYQAEAAAPE